MLVYLVSLYVEVMVVFISSNLREIIYNPMKSIKHLMTFEEVGLKNLLSPGGQDSLEKIVRAAAGKVWFVARKGIMWSMTRPAKDLQELVEIQILVGQQSGRVEAQVLMRAPQVRSKRLKGLISMLRSRSVAVDYRGDSVTFRGWPQDDRCVCVRETVPSDDHTGDWLVDTAARDWESLFSHLMEEVDRNERKHLRNTNRINKFFTNRGQFESLLRPVMSATARFSFEKSESHHISRGIKVLDPTMRFTFEVPSLNILSGSDKHLMVDRQILNIIRCMAIGCRRITADYPGTEMMLYLQDKAVWVVVKNNNREVVQSWSSTEDLPDCFVELHDLSREMSMDPIRGFSKDQNRSVISGFNLKFSFQSVVTQTKESSRVSQAMLIAKTSPDREALRILEQAVDICEKIRTSYEGHRVNLWATGGRIMVEIRLDVDSTWQDTTVAEQSQDEGDLEED